MGIRPIALTFDTGVNVSMGIRPIALTFDTGVNCQKLHTQMCQWLDKHHKGVRDYTFCVPPPPPHSLKYNVSIHE